MAVCSWLCKRPHAPDYSNVGVLWFADGVAGSNIAIVKEVHLLVQ